MRFGILGLAILAAPAFSAPNLELGPPPPSEEVRGAIRDLDHKQYKVRAQAARRLLAAGKESIGPLTQVLESGTPEGAERAAKILERLMDHEDEATALATREALHQLAGKRGRARGPARGILKRHQGQVVERLYKLKATAQYEGDRVRAIYLDRVEDLAAALPLLREFPELAELSISNRKFDDAGMKHVLPLKKLQWFNLYQSGIGDETLKLFRHFPDLESVPMGETKITDAGLAHIADLTQLEYVGLRGNNVTDAGVAHLKKLTNLTGLYLGETKVTDAGLEHLRGMKRMHHLRLHNTAVTDAGLEHLHGMGMLSQLDLWRTKVTDKGVERLQEMNPQVQIFTKDPSE